MSVKRESKVLCQKSSALSALYGFDIYHNLARNYVFSKENVGGSAIMAEPFFLRGDEEYAKYTRLCERICDTHRYRI